MDRIEFFKISLNELSDVAISGIDMSDYPDFCDAYVESAVWKDTGVPLTDAELERIDEGEVAEEALQRVAEGDYVRDYDDMER
jgi:hypothetical protein